MPQDKVTKCFDEGTRGGERHQGIRIITPSAERAHEHLTKALHNFQAMTVFHEQRFSDWSAAAAFYTLYHGLLALLASQGYESRNQSCTFALVEKFITQSKMTYLTLDDLHEIFDKDVTMDLEHSRKLLDIRERMQYSTQTALEEEEFRFLKNRTKELLDKIRLELEE